MFNDSAAKNSNIILNIRDINNLINWFFKFDVEKPTIIHNKIIINIFRVIQNGEWRLLDVDNKMVVPTNTHIRLIATGSDVIHSFAVPSLGLKLDCIPGRLNQASVITERTGLFYGQWS